MRALLHRMGAAARHPAALVAIAIPLASGAAAARALGLGWYEVAGALPVRVFASALATLCVIHAARAAAARRWPAFAVACAALLLVAQVWAGAAFRVSGDLEAGEGEPAPPWASYEAGLLSGSVALEVAAIEPGEVVLRVAGQERRIRAGVETDVGGGLLVRAGEPSEAPHVVVVSGASGKPLEEGMVKIGPSLKGFVELGLLPHRFYLSPAPAKDGDAEPGVRVRIARGKLVMPERVLGWAEPLAFDGLVLRVERGARWVPLHVTRTTPPVLPISAALCGLAAVVLAARARRAR
jgi:hypothetical protein